MSNKNIPIQFLLKQLEKEENILKINKSENFRVKKVNNNIFIYHKDFNGELDLNEFTGGGYLFEGLFTSPNKKIIATEFIRTCLSRINGQAVLGIFDVSIPPKIVSPLNELLTDILYLRFDYELRNSKPLVQAIDALDQKMLELVPEYQEFYKNNN